MAAANGDSNADWHAILAVLVRYAEGIDRRDFAAVERCFADDATARYAGTEVGPGATRIVAFLRQALTSAASTHFVGNVQIEVDGDRASSESVTIAFHVDQSGGGSEMRMRGLRYLDELKRRDEGWRISRRVHVPTWMATLDGSTADD